MPRRRHHRRPLLKRFTEAVADVVDQTVLCFAPRAGLRRQAFRELARAHEAFSSSSRDEDNDDRRAGIESASPGGRLRQWFTSRLSTDSLLEEDRESVVDHARTIYRDDTTGGAVEQKCNHVAHRPFTPQSRIRPIPELGPAVPNITQEQADRWNAQLEWIWERVNQKIDRTRTRSVWQCLRVAERVHNVDGESFTVFSDVGGADRPIPLTIEVIDPQRVATPPQHAMNPRVRMGVETDVDGRIVAYQIRRAHPGDAKDLAVDAETYDRVPAERVSHVFEQWLPEQSRGLSWMMRTLNTQKDLKDNQEAAIIAAQVQACIAAIVKTETGAMRAAIGAGNAVDSQARRLQDVLPGQFHYLNAGEDVEFLTPTHPNGNYEPFQNMAYRGIAAGMNWPYELLRGDWRGTSFAGGRLALTGARLDVAARHRLLKELWLIRLWNRMVEEAVITGADGMCDIPAALYNRAPWFFHLHEWISPPWPYALTPGEEVKADITEVDANLATKADKISARGGDIDEVFAQRRLERKLEREYEIEPQPKAGAAPPPSRAAKPGQSTGTDENEDTDETDDAEQEAEALAL